MTAVATAVNNNNIEYSTTDSRLAMELEPGFYEIEATLVSEIGSTNTGRDFTLEVTVAELIPYLGHQHDYTVGYTVGPMPPTYTPVPTTTPSIGPIGTPTLIPFPDPGVAIPTAIAKAAKAWNDSTASTHWPNMLFCEKGKNNCSDNKSVSIDYVDGRTHRKGNIRSPLVPSCGVKVACVKPSPILAIHHLNPPGNGHMGNLSMLIEQPAWGYKISDGHTRYAWTNKSGDNLTKVIFDDGTEGKLRYLPGIIMHEFGHTAGLEDLYQPKYGSKYSNYLMGGNQHVTAIPLLDIEYLRQLYRNAHSADPR